MIASGIHTLAILQRLTVQAIYGDGPWWRAAHWRMWVSCSPSARLQNQHGVPVLTSGLVIVMFRREAAAD